MGLVDYSDSEGGSDQEVKPKPAAKPGSKPAFQKVIDRSNPGKIKVSLPGAAQPTKEADNEDERPAKRVKLGGGGLNFNALLPAPKRAPGTTTGGARKSGLRAGVSLKTGAAPGFSRAPVPGYDEVEAQDDEDYGVHASAVDESEEMASTSISEEKPREVVPKKSATMFRPLSVARKVAKKPPPVPGNSSSASIADLSPKDVAPPPSKPKVSLFSTHQEIEEKRELDTAGHNTPIHQVPSETDSYTEPTPAPYVTPAAHQYSQTPTTGSLSSIASDLNLTPAARRQLLGRQGFKQGSSTAASVVNFNTDQEYAANELIRQAGEQQAHNPVRAIAAGKHSLSQLVNAVSNQREALEEQFATGRRNKKEAGSKYGW